MKKVKSELPRPKKIGFYGGNFYKKIRKLERRKIENVWIFKK